MEENHCLLHMFNPIRSGNTSDMPQRGANSIQKGQGYRIVLGIYRKHQQKKIWIEFVGFT